MAALPADCHVIAVDQLGHGYSDKPEIRDWAMIADATAELLGSLDIAFDLAVGHSMGGHCLVLIAAAAAPLIKKIVLIDPVIMEPRNYQQPADFSATYQMVAKRRNSWASSEEMYDRFKDRHPYQSWDPLVLRDYCDHGLHPDGQGQYMLACPPTTEASIYAASAATDPWPYIARIKQPVTILRAPQFAQQGIFDFASSPTPPTLAAAFAHGSDILIPDLTHFMPMEAPPRIAALLWNAQETGLTD